MTPLQRKKATITENIAAALDDVAGARDVIPGKYITPASLVMQLLGELMETVTKASIEATFAGTIADLPATVKKLARIYGNNPHHVPWPGKTISLLGNDYIYRCDVHGTPTVYKNWCGFNPSFIGPGGEITQAIPGEGYTLIGEEILRESFSDNPHVAYYVHELAKAITAIEGKGYEMHITQGHSTYVFLRSYGQAILDEHVPYHLEKRDRRDIDRDIAAIAADHAKTVAYQRENAEKRSKMRASFEETLANATPGIEPMMALGLDVLKKSGENRLRIAYTYQSKGKTKVDIGKVDALDRLYGLRDHASQHRKSLQDAASFQKQGGYTISRALAAFLHSRYGTDISDLIKQVESSQNMTCQILDPQASNKTSMFNLMIRNAELRGRFDLGTGVRWEYTKIIFENDLPETMKSTMEDRELSEIIDLSSIPGLAQVSKTGFYPRKQGFTLTMDATPVPIEEAMAALEERRLKQAA